MTDKIDEIIDKIPTPEKLRKNLNELSLQRATEILLKFKELLQIQKVELNNSYRIPFKMGDQGLMGFLNSKLNPKGWQIKTLGGGYPDESDPYLQISEYRLERLR